MRRANRFLIERRGAFDCNCCQSGKRFSQNQKHRAREIAKKLGPLGLTWSCNSRANLDYDTIKSFKDNGLRLFLAPWDILAVASAAPLTNYPTGRVGYESGNDETLRRIKKWEVVQLDWLGWVSREAVTAVMTPKKNPPDLAGKPDAGPAPGRSQAQSRPPFHPNPKPTFACSTPS